MLERDQILKLKEVNFAILLLNQPFFSLSHHASASMVYASMYVYIPQIFFLCSYLKWDNVNNLVYLSVNILLLCIFLVLPLHALDIYSVFLYDLHECITVYLHRKALLGYTSAFLLVLFFPLNLKLTVIECAAGSVFVFLLLVSLQCAHA